MNSTIANRTSENAYLILWLICIFVLPVSLDAQTGNTDQGGVENSAVQAKSQLVDALIAEISQLIPGKYEPGSKNDELVRGIAKSVVEQNQTKIRLFLDDLIAADSRVPPKDLILAGLAYATNNAVNGQVLLERASTNHPNHPAIDVAFCRLALSQGRNFEALVLANKALKDNQSAKHDEISKHHFDVAILDALTVAQMRRQQIDAAKEYAKQWEAIDPSNDKMLMASGEINFLQNNVNIALEFLNKRSPEVQALTPSEVVIAKWFQSNRDGDNYSKWVTSAFEKHKNNKLAQVEYAAWLLRQEKFDDTLSVLDSYDKTHGNSNESKLLRARVAFSRQDYSNAESVFEELFNRQPNNFENSYLYTLSLLESSDVNKHKIAVQIAQQNYRARPNNQLAMATFGWALLVNGDKKNAMELLTKANNSGVMLPDAAYMVARLMESEERKFQAQRILELT